MSASEGFAVFRRRLFALAQEIRGDAWSVQEQVAPPLALGTIKRLRPSLRIST
jgi:hypothetical protein